MIKDKDLKLREMKDKECIAFVYDLLLNDEQNNYMRCFFHKVEGKVWQVEVWEYSTSNKSDVIYRWGYEMPKDNMPITMICAFGLIRLQRQMKEEVQMKSELDFTIGSLVDGIYG